MGSPFSLTFENGKKYLFSDRLAKRPQRLGGGESHFRDPILKCAVQLGQKLRAVQVCNATDGRDSNLNIIVGNEPSQKISAPVSLAKQP